MDRSILPVPDTTYDGPVYDDAVGVGADGEADFDHLIDPQLRLSVALARQ